MKFSGELKNVKEDFFLQKIFPFFKAPLTSAEGEAVEKTAAKMRVVAPVPRPQMMRKVFLVGKNDQMEKESRTTCQGSQQQPTEGKKIPSL